MNRLYFGDNLKWLSDRKEFPDESVDLVYLDPPFNSNADYNVLFREPSGQVSQAQFHAFTDTWSWADAADTYHQFIDTCRNVAVVELMEALHSFLKHSPMMAYLAMMAPRLVELHRLLKPTGSLYLHCRSEEHTSELQSPCNLVCRLLLEKKKKNDNKNTVYLIYNNKHISH